MDAQSRKRVKRLRADLIQRATDVGYRGFFSGRKPITARAIFKASDSSRNSKLKDRSVVLLLVEMLVEQCEERDVAMGKHLSEVEELRATLKAVEAERDHWIKQAAGAVAFSEKVVEMMDLLKGFKQGLRVSRTN